MECQGDGIAVLSETTKVCHELALEDRNEKAFENESVECEQNAILAEGTGGEAINLDISTEDVKPQGVHEGKGNNDEISSGGNYSKYRSDTELNKDILQGPTSGKSSEYRNEKMRKNISYSSQNQNYGKSGHERSSSCNLKSSSHKISDKSCDYEEREFDKIDSYEQAFDSADVSEEGTPRDAIDPVTEEPKTSEEGKEGLGETKTGPQMRDYCGGPAPLPSGGTYNAMYGPDAGMNNDVLQGIPGLPSDQLLECRHDIISSTSINPYSTHGHPYGSMPESDSPCYFLSSSRQIFTVVESVVHFLTQPVVNFIRGEWIVSFMPFPIAQHVCISLDDGMKRYEEVLKVEPNYDNPSRVQLITVEHRLVPGNTMHRPRFREALRQSLTEVGKQLSGEAPWEIFVSRASGRSLAMDTMIHSFLSESHEPLETHCSPLVEHSCTPIFAKLTAAPYSIVGTIFRPILRYASWLVVSSHYQLHETIKLNLNFKGRRIEATSLDSALARSSYSEDVGSSVVLLDAVSYVSDSLTGNAVLSSNSLLGRNLHPFLNFDSNPIFNRGSNPCFNATFAPPSNTSVPVNSVGLIITPPGHGAQIAPNQIQQNPGNVPFVNQYPAPLFAYSPYGLLQQVVPPIPIIPENMYAPPPSAPAAYGHFVEVPRPELNLNPNAQDFFPDMQNERPATAEPYATEHEMNSSIKQSPSESTLQISHCQVTGTFVHHSPSNYESEPGIVVVRARESHSDLTNDTGCATRTHSKSWSEETAEVGEHEMIDPYYTSVSPVTYDGQPILIENSYGSDKSYNSHCPDCHPPRRNDHYPRGNVSNYYGNYNKPRFNTSGTPNTRYAPPNDYSRGSESPRQGQQGNYSPSERGGGHYYNNRGRGGRGRAYKQNKPHYNQNTQTEGNYYRRGNRYNNNNNNNNNYNKKPAE